MRGNMKHKPWLLVFSHLMNAAAIILPALALALDPKFYRGADGNNLGPRTALVVGVSTLSAESGFASLKNPAHDAEAVSSRLRELGFTVINLNATVGSPELLTRQRLKREIYQFI